MSVGNRHLVVGTAHLFWNPQVLINVEIRLGSGMRMWCLMLFLLVRPLYINTTTQQREDVKLLQMAELLKVTHAEIEAETNLSSSGPDYVILGDFNSTEVVTNQ